MFGPGLAAARGRPAPVAVGEIRRIERPLPSQQRNEAMEGLRQRLLGLRVPPSNIQGAPPPPSLTGMAQGLGLGMLNLMESGREGTALTAQDVLSVPLIGGFASVVRGVPQGVGVFGGRLARQFPKEKMREFQELRRAGASADETFNKTGFFRGADGKVRFEIPDATAKFATGVDERIATIKNVKGDFQDTGLKLGVVFDHPKLFANYPGLQDTKVLFTKTNTPLNGEFNPVTNTIMLNVKNRTVQEIKATLLHEAQHAVQELENFARGGNPDFMKFLLAKSPNSTLAKNPEAVFQAYRQLAGEVEARVVGQRSVMPERFSKAVAPFRQEDFPRRQQVLQGVRVPGGQPFEP